MSRNLAVRIAGFALCSIICLATAAYQACAAVVVATVSSDGTHRLMVRIRADDRVPETRSGTLTYSITIFNDSTGDVVKEVCGEKAYQLLPRDHPKGLLLLKYDKQLRGLKASVTLSYSDNVDAGELGTYSAHLY